MEFDRWIPIKESSYPYKVFKQYNAELKRLDMSYYAANKYTYKTLGISGADWKDKASDHLDTNGNDELLLENWSETFNKFDNWHRLNFLMAMSSYFETFLAAIIKLALDSDPGTFVKGTHAVDGIASIKHGESSFNKKEIRSLVTKCTKGDWQTRQNNYKRIFGELPKAFAGGLSDLEKIRKLRNKVGHAFGRDIKRSRDYSVTHICQMETLSRKTLLRYHKLVQECAQEINQQLMYEHIGNFQELYVYHHHRSTMKGTGQEKARVLKKVIGRDTEDPVSKEFCQWVISYYDSL